MFFRNTIAIIKTKNTALYRISSFKFSSVSTRVDFGKAAAEYGKHRHGLPKRFFDELKSHGVALPKNKILDIGTGTGDVARKLTLMQCEVKAIDPSAKMIDQARTIDSKLNVKVDYSVGSAESITLPTHSFDAVTAVQAYHWFDTIPALQEISRVLKTDGQFVIASYDWKAKSGISWLSESLIRKYNPQWKVLDFYNKPQEDLLKFKFRDIKIVGFMEKEAYSHEDWVGRISTSYGIGPVLPKEKVTAFKAELTSQLRSEFPKEPLEIWHKCHIIFSRRPTFFASQSVKELIPDQTDQTDQSNYQFNQQMRRIVK